MNLKQLIGRLFGQKVSGAGFMSSLMGPGQPIWTPREYAKLSQESYMKCVISFSAIRACAKGAAKIPFIIRDRDTKKEIEDKKLPLWKILHRPNPWQAGAAFWEGVYAYWKMNGNSYIEGVVGDADPSPMGLGRPPDQLFSLRPDMMKAIASEVGTPMAYVYERGGRKKTWDMDAFDGTGAIVHWKSFHPLNEWYGLSEVEVAAYAIDQHNEASKWNKALLENSGAPSGVLSRKVGPDQPIVLPEKQYNQLKLQISDEIKGSRNAGSIPIMDGGLEWQSMGLSPREMDWIEGKHVSAREICHAHGVPPFLLGIPGDSTYNNYKEARQGLYEDTILPMVDGLCDELNMKLAPLFGDQYEIGYDEDEIPALAPKREAKWLAVGTANWLTTDEKREATGYEPIGSPEAEEVLIPSTLTPLTGVMDPPELPQMLGPDGKPLPPDPEQKPGLNGKPLFNGKKPELTPAAKARLERKYVERLVHLNGGR